MTRRAPAARRRVPLAEESTGGVRAALYARVSTATQVNVGTSLRDQERRLRAYAKSAALTVTELYCDAGVSGVDDRPGFDRMRRDAAQGAFDVILATNADRLSRRLSGWPALYDEVAPHGVDLVTIDDGVDSRGAGGAIIGSIRSAIAADERERIRQRTTRGRAAALAEGRWVTSTAPFGYRRIRATTGRGWLLAPDPREREIVTFIFARLVRDGSHPSRVTGELGERGWTQRSGLPWTPVSLRDWARRPHTIEIAAGRTRTDAVWQQWEPLLPAHHVQQWRDWRESSYRPQNARGPYLLAGMVVMPCGNNGLGPDRGDPAVHLLVPPVPGRQAGWRQACRVPQRQRQLAGRHRPRTHHGRLSGRLELVIRAQTADTSVGSVEDAQDRLAALDERIGETLATLLREGMPAAAAARAVADMRRDREIAAAELARLHRHAYTADARPNWSRRCCRRHGRPCTRATTGRGAGSSRRSQHR